MLSGDLDKPERFGQRAEEADATLDAVRRPAPSSTRSGLAVSVPGHYVDSSPDISKGNSVLRSSTVVSLTADAGNRRPPGVALYPVSDNYSVSQYSFSRYRPERGDPRVFMGHVRWTTITPISSTARGTPTAGTTLFGFGFGAAGSSRH